TRAARTLGDERQYFFACMIEPESVPRADQPKKVRSGSEPGARRPMRFLTLDLTNELSSIGIGEDGFGSFESVKRHNSKFGAAVEEENSAQLDRTDHLAANWDVKLLIGGRAGIRTFEMIARSFGSLHRVPPQTQPWQARHNHGLTFFEA